MDDRDDSVEDGETNGSGSEVNLPAPLEQSREGIVPASPTHAGDRHAEAATQLFIENLSGRLRAASEDGKNERKQLEDRGTVLFGFRIATTALALVLVIAGFVLLALTGIAFGVTAEAVGLLSGGASVALARSENDIRARRNRIESAEKRQNDLLNAVAVTNLVPDEGERTKIMAELARRLAAECGKQFLDPPSSGSPESKS